MASGIPPSKRPRKGQGSEKPIRGSPSLRRRPEVSLSPKDSPSLSDKTTKATKATKAPKTTKATKAPAVKKPDRSPEGGGGPKASRAAKAPSKQGTSKEAPSVSRREQVTRSGAATRTREAARARMASAEAMALYKALVETMQGGPPKKGAKVKGGGAVRTAPPEIPRTGGVLEGASTFSRGEGPLGAGPSPASKSAVSGQVGANDPGLGLESKKTGSPLKASKMAWERLKSMMPRGIIPDPVLSFGRKIGVFNTGTAAALAVTVLPWLIQKGAGFRDAVSGRAASRAMEAERMSRRGALGSAMRRERLLRTMMANEARLALLRPHTYAELATGERLPMGAMVFGGIPRRDLIEEAAYLMSRLPAPSQMVPDMGLAPAGNMPMMMLPQNGSPVGPARNVPLDMTRFLSGP